MTMRSQWRQCLVEACYTQVCYCHSTTARLPSLANARCEVGEYKRRFIEGEHCNISRRAWSGRAVKSSFHSQTCQSPYRSIRRRGVAGNGALSTPMRAQARSTARSSERFCKRHNASKTFHNNSYHFLQRAVEWINFNAGNQLQFAPLPCRFAASDWISVQPQRV